MDQKTAEEKKTEAIGKRTKKRRFRGKWVEGKRREGSKESG